MGKLNKLAIVSAVAATVTAITAYGQTAPSHDAQTGIRSSTAAIGGNKDDTRMFAAQVVNAQAQIVNAQAQLKARNEAARLVETRAATDDKGRPTGAVMYLADPGDPASGRVHVTEAQRATEHARYEANRRRRVGESVSITASEPARARRNEQARAGVETPPALSVQSRAEIRWSESAWSGITASERATAVPNEQMARAIDRAAPSKNAGASDDRRARDILSGLR